MNETQSDIQSTELVKYCPLTPSHTKISSLFVDKIMALLNEGSFQMKTYGVDDQYSWKSTETIAFVSGKQKITISLEVDR